MPLTLSQLCGDGNFNRVHPHHHQQSLHHVNRRQRAQWGSRCQRGTAQWKGERHRTDPRWPTRTSRPRPSSRWRWGLVWRRSDRLIRTRRRSSRASPSHCNDGSDAVPGNVGAHLSRGPVHLGQDDEGASRMDLPRRDHGPYLIFPELRNRPRWGKNPVHGRAREGGENKSPFWYRPFPHINPLVCTLGQEFDLIFWS